MPAATIQSPETAARAVSQCQPVHVVELSSAHLSPAMRRWLADQAPLSSAELPPGIARGPVQRFDHGWRLGVSPGLYVAAGAPARLVGLIQAAYLAGITLLCFDHDANTVDDIPQYPQITAARLSVELAIVTPSRPPAMTVIDDPGRHRPIATGTGELISFCSDRMPSEFGAYRCRLSVKTPPVGPSFYADAYTVRGALDVVLKAKGGTAAEGLEVLGCGSVNITPAELQADGACVARWSDGVLTAADGRELDHWSIEQA